MSDKKWPISIWLSRADTDRCKTCDPYEVDDANYVLKSTLEDVVKERDSWRDIAVRLMKERHDEGV